MRMILVSLSLCNKQALIDTSIFNLFRNCLIHILSPSIYLRAIYSTLVVEVKTVCCFLLHQETIAPYKKNQVPITDFLSLDLPAYLLLTYLTQQKSGRLTRSCPWLVNVFVFLSGWDYAFSHNLYIKSRYIISFRYLATCFAALRWSTLWSALCLLSCSITNEILNMVLQDRYMSLLIRN